MDKEPLANKSFFYNILLLSSIMLIIFGTIAWMLIIPTTTYQERMLQNYYKENGLQYKTFQIPVDSSTNLNVLAILPDRFDTMENEEITAIIHFKSVRNEKAQAISLMWSVARHGFATFIIDGRGYDESGNLQEFYGQEPWDIPKVIDYLVKTYPQINQTHLGVSGFNYGAGVLLIAQAIEPRIFTSVLYQPATNISQLYLQYRSQQIPGDLTNYGLLQGKETRDAFYWCNTTNSNNLMLIQGTQDDVISPTKTSELYTHLNGESRDDILLINREGLNNQQTIDDVTAKKYAIAWYTHFFLDQSIDLTKLDQRILTVTEFPYDPPIVPLNFSILNILGFIAIELGAWFIFRFVLFQYQKRKEESQRKYGVFGDMLMAEPTVDSIEQKEPTEKQKTIVRRFLYEAAILWTTSAIIGSIGIFTTPGAFLGAYIALPVVTLILLRHIQDPESRAKLQGFFTDRDRIRFTLIGLVAALGPILIAILLHDNYARTTLQPTISPWRPASMFYYAAVILLFIWSYKCLEYFFLHKQRGALLIITGILAISLVIFNFFIPIVASSPNIWWTILSIIVMAFSIIFLGILVMLGRKLWGDTVVGTVFMAVIITILLSQTYYSILII
jgi:cephalosporin-C deacetylase-like acetyl esterase